MEITREQFDQVVANMATKEDVQNAKEEILFRLTEAMATIEEGLGPEERFALFERKLNRIEEVLHIEV